MEKISGRWTDKEKYAFEAGLEKYGRGNWRLFLPLIPTKTQLQVRQHAYAYFKKKRLKAERLLRKRDHISSSESSSGSESESDSDSEDEDEDITPVNSDRDSSNSRPTKKSRLDHSSSPPTVRNSSETESQDSTPVEYRRRRKKKKHKKKKSGKKRRSMWTEEEHRCFLKGYKTHPRNWNYLATLVTSKTPTQIRTHAYSVFQRRRRVGTPLPSGFENMDHSWHRREDGTYQNDNGELNVDHLNIVRSHGNGLTTYDGQTPKSHTSKARQVPMHLQRDAKDPCEQLVMKAISDRAAKWTCATAMFPPQPPNAARGSGITLSDYLVDSIVY
jgi:hypothetical protein